MTQEPHDPHGAEFDTASIQWGGAPISAVAMPAHMGLSADLVHALDYVVLIQVLFNVSSQTPSTPVTVWTQLKERGIRSAKNGKELVGRDAVYDAFKRLMGAGYVRRVELPNEKHPGRKGPIAYTVYDNPAWNPDWQVHQVGSEPLKKPQVGMLPGTPEAVKPEAEETAGRNASRNAGSGVPGSGVPGSGGRRVPAGQNASGVPGSIKASPPLPPEGMGNPSPLPPTDSSRRRGAADGDGGKFSELDKQAAAEILETLPGSPWDEVGPVDAGHLAPLLLNRMDAQGWPTITEMTDADKSGLVACLTANPGGIRPGGAAGVIRTKRIPNLRRYRPTGSSSSSSGTAGSSLPPWCGKCNQGIKPSHVFERMVPLPDGSDDVDCPACHPRKVNASTAN